MKITKFIFVGFILVFAFSLIFAVSNVKTTTVLANEEEPETKYIDVYLIGGQSNAVGYSPYSGNETEVYNNVWYAGEVERHLLTNDGYGTPGYNKNYRYLTFNSFKHSVMAGYGLSGRIGPEYGMASEIAKTAKENRPALIFKTAAGGTSLRDSTDELSSQFGNWYPRSLWPSGYTPNIEHSSTTNNPTGILYHLFVTNFKQVYDELVANGFTPVIKGMAWMQGETDLNRANGVYDSLLKTFITDLREDLFEITNDNTVYTMPFVIGEIATSFSVYNNPTVPPMIEMQRKVATDMGSSVETIQTDDLIVVKPDGTHKGPDNYHFDFNDAVELGKRFIDKIFTLNGQLRISKISSNGNIVYTLEDDNKVIVKLTPNKHYKFLSLLLNGVDVTENVENLEYTTILTELSNNFVANFELKPTFNLTYAENKYADFITKPKIAYDGEMLSFKTYAKKDYKVTNVTFNNQKVDYNDTTKNYEFTPTCSGTFRIETEYVGENKEITKKTNKGLLVGIISGSCLLVGCIAGSVFFIIKRKKHIKTK